MKLITRITLRLAIVLLPIMIIWGTVFYFSMVTEINDEDGKVLELRVAEGDMGKVIGRQGRIAKEIRTIIKTVAQRTGEKVTVEIVD